MDAKKELKMFSGCITMGVLFGYTLMYIMGGFISNDWGLIDWHPMGKVAWLVFGGFAAFLFAAMGCCVVADFNKAKKS